MEAFYPGERKSLSFLSMWEDYGFVFLGIMRGLCSFGDLDMFIIFFGGDSFCFEGIMISSYPFGGDFFVLGIMIFLWGLFLFLRGL